MSNIFLNKSALTEKKLNGIRKLNDLAQQRGQTLAQMALAWLLLGRRAARIEN